ncbi:MAG TPA: thioesterase family protein [Chloroflexota bacterium]|nr:thioesterase family protein [Chloroflexota bacterium]
MAVTPGMIGEASLTVDQAHTASALGSGNVPTLGTPAVVALLERAAVHAVRKGLEVGQETVGTMVNVRHLSPTPIGKRVRALAVVTNVDERTITFDVSASDSSGKIAEGTHQRVVVDREQFIWKAASRGI